MTIKSLTSESEDVIIVITRLTERHVELNVTVNGQTHAIAYMNSPSGRIAIAEDLDPQMVMQILEVWGPRTTEDDPYVPEPSVITRGTWKHDLEILPTSSGAITTCLVEDVCHFDIMGDLVYIFNENIIEYRLHRGTGSNFTCTQLRFHGLPYPGKGKINAFLWTGLTNYATRSCVVQDSSVILNLSPGLNISNTNLDVSISFNGIYQKN